jgi:transposase
MIRMLIVGYCFDIRSEQRLFEEEHLNLTYRWFCRLGPIHHSLGHDLRKFSFHEVRPIWTRT